MDCFDGDKPPILAATLLQTVVRMILPCYKFVKDQRLECLKQFFKFLLPLCNECRNPPGRGAGGGCYSFGLFWWDVVWRFFEKLPKENLA